MDDSARIGAVCIISGADPDHIVCVIDRHSDAKVHVIAREFRGEFRLFRCCGVAEQAEHIDAAVIGFAIIIVEWRADQQGCALQVHRNAIAELRIAADGFLRAKFVHLIPAAACVFVQIHNAAAIFWRAHSQIAPII